MEVEITIKTYNEVTPIFSNASEISATAIKEPICDCVIEVRHIANL